MNSTHAEDVVRINDENFKQMFEEARPLKASVNDEATFFKHPLENSTNRVDHVIFMPILVTITLVVSGLDYKSVYQQIRAAYRDQVKLVVQTKTDTFENMYIQSIPHEETPGNFDSIVLNITLQETQISDTTVTFTPDNPKDGATTDRGQQEPAEVEEAKKQSTLKRWLS